MTTRRRGDAATRRRGAFTLIEIIIVIAIIVILATIGVSISSGVVNTAKDRATKATLASLDSAMSLFLKDHAEPNAGNWVAALQAFPDSAKPLAGKFTTVGGNPAILDAWGQPIQYIPASASNKKVGFFQSYGRDQIPSSDDIFSNGTSAAQ